MRNLTSMHRNDWEVYGYISTNSSAQTCSPTQMLHRSQTTRASFGTQAGNRQKKAEALTEVKQEPGAPPGLWRLLQVQTRAHGNDDHIAPLSSEIISLAASARAYETAKQASPLGILGISTQPQFILSLMPFMCVCLHRCVYMCMWVYIHLYALCVKARGQCSISFSVSLYFIF